MELKLKVNNVEKVFKVDPGEMLGDVLRRNGFTSVRKACGTGSCGVCTVLIDDNPIASCAYLALKAEGHNITTIEGVSKDAEIIGKFLNDEGAAQCGYCSPGFILTVIAMKKALKNPTEDEIKHYLVGNLCRCTGYLGHLRAVKKYLQEVSE